MTLWKNLEFLNFAKSGANIVFEPNPDTKFDQVAGIDEAKEEIMELVDFLKFPETYS